MTIEDAMVELAALKEKVIIQKGATVAGVKAEDQDATGAEIDALIAAFQAVIDQFSPQP